MRRAAKIDANQSAIVDGLRAMGAFVQSLATVGNGCPDLLVCWRGANVLLEVKQEGETFTPAQKKWHSEFPGKAHVVRSLSDAVMVLQSYGRQG
jgi:hypothetical protein